MDKPISLAQQIEACDFGAKYWQAIARSRRPDHEAHERAKHYRAAAATLRKVQSGEYVLEDELLECDAPAPGAADGAGRGDE